MAVAPVLVRVVRDGVVESAHRGHVAVAAADGRLVTGLGAPHLPAYVRSAVKPFQALATLELLAHAGADLDATALAIACASHEGSDDHQIEVARVLALAGLDESALRCPPALPRAQDALLAQRVPERLAHNCSGKHAGFLYAHTAGGGQPARYLDVDVPLQARVRDHLAAVSGTQPTGPGVDGCGAPAWLLPLQGLATAFARLAAGVTPALRRVRAAMTARPDLVGGVGTDDALLMRADARVVAKRGAEAVLGVGVAGAWAHGVSRQGVPGQGASGEGAFGVAVKIADGGARADGPVVAALLAAAGVGVPESLRHRPVLGGGVPHGRLEVADAVTRCGTIAGRAGGEAWPSARAKDRR